MNKHVIVQNDGILIQNFTYLKFVQRVNDIYGKGKYNLTVEMEKMIKKIDVSFDNSWMIIYSFFLPEFYEIFSKLSEYYNDAEYGEIADELYENTWLKKNSGNTPKLDLGPLKKISKPLKDFQLEFIKKYPELKYVYDLDGYILSFEQGLGKTLTAIALAECLHKEIVYIICPNSIKEFWGKEIQDCIITYGNDEKLWKSEVYVANTPSYKFHPESTKYIITNQENIPAIYKYVDPKKNSMIIVDECQNFRGLDTKRVDELLNLKKISKTKDTLMMSGTPIKALASELTPALLMIDPHFTRDGAQIFNEIFSDKKNDLSRIVALRFKRVIYRKLKRDTLTLPEKTIENINLDIPNADNYTTSAFRDEIAKLYHTEYLKRIKSGIFTDNKKHKFYRQKAVGYDFEKLKQEFSDFVYKYSNVSKIVTDDYLGYIFQNNVPFHTLTKVRYNNIDDNYDMFLKRYMNKVEPEDKDIVKKFDGFQGWKFAAKSAYMTAFGKVYAKMQNECFIEIWKWNAQDMIDRIQKNDKKTVILTYMRPIADYIAADLEKRGIKCVKITGGTDQRQKLIDKFKTDDSVRVLVATTQTLGTGVTLTEANQMFFFGTPWRDADFQQAVDRIHRIGQTTPVHIYNIILRSNTQNITQRIQEIMHWSADMVNQVLTESFIF